MKPKLLIPPADYKKLTDEELIHRYVHRHELVAINYLFDRYAHLVFGICMKHLGNVALAKNATKELFIKLADDLKRYTIDQFKPWLFQYVKSYSILEADKTITVENNAIVIGTDMKFDDIRIDINTEKMSVIFENAIKELYKDERICIDLFYLKNMNYAQIATETGYIPAQVKRILQSGTYNLKTKFGAQVHISI